MQLVVIDNSVAPPFVLLPCLPVFTSNDLMYTIQENLGLRLSSRRECEVLRERLTDCQRERDKASLQIRDQRQTKDIKLAEMSETIRILSSRADMYAQVVQARQELEVERLMHHQLKEDLRACR
jgi:hypothetical protein